MTLLRKLWELPPSAWWYAIRRRVVSTPDITPAWHRVRSGPLAGAELLLAVGATDTWDQMIAGVHDRELVDAVRRHLAARSGGTPCVWDVGAHFGYHSLAFASEVGDRGHVVAFEPNPANQGRFRQHLDRNPALAARIRLVGAAVGRDPGRAEFVFSDHVESGLSTGGHLADAHTPQGPDAYRQFRSTPVDVTTLDVQLDEKAPPPIVVKIDVEGAESAVIEGAGRLLATVRPVLLIEVHHILEMHRLHGLLGAAGYRIRVLDETASDRGRCFIEALPFAVGTGK